MSCCVQLLKIAQKWEYGVYESVVQGAGTQIILLRLGLSPTSRYSLVGLQLPMWGGKTLSTLDTLTEIFQCNSPHLTVVD